MGILAPLLSKNDWFRDTWETTVLGFILSTLLFSSWSREQLGSSSTRGTFLGIFGALVHVFYRLAVVNYF